MGENEPYRLVHAEQPLFVLHNEVIRFDVVGKLRFAIHLALHKAYLLALFLVDGEIALMRPVRGDLVQIRHVRFIAKLALQIADDVFIFFFKHLRVLAVASRVIIAVIAAVFGNLVNEKQTQHLDPARIQFPLPLDVGADRLTNLNAPLERYQLLVAADLPGINFQTVQEGHRIIAAVNSVWQNPIAVCIFGQTIGEVIQIITAIDLFHDCPRSRCAFDLKAETCRRRFILIKINALTIDIAIRRRAALQRHTEGGNFLDQMLIIGVQRVEPIDHVVFFLVRGGIAQRKERLELFEAFLGLLALHTLRLVDDQNRIRLCNNIDGLAAVEGIKFFVNDALVLAGIERLHIDDHDVDRAVGCKAVNFRQSVGIVDKEADLLVVFACKMLLRSLE